MSKELSIFEVSGGRPFLEKIAKHFYDKVYSDPWLKLYFKNTNQETIERQQVDFMTGALGGPRIYGGRMPADAHTHINITPELFEAREKLLLETLKEVGASPELTDRWLKIEQAFKRHLIKNSPDECRKRWNSDEILDFENPNSSGDSKRRTA